MSSLVDEIRDGVVMVYFVNVDNCDVIFFGYFNSMFYFYFGCDLFGSIIGM